MIAQSAGHHAAGRIERGTIRYRHLASLLFNMPPMTPAHLQGDSQGAADYTQQPDGPFGLRAQAALGVAILQAYPVANSSTSLPTSWTLPSSEKPPTFSGLGSSSSLERAEGRGSPNPSRPGFGACETGLFPSPIPANWADLPGIRRCGWTCG